MSQNEQRKHYLKPADFFAELIKCRQDGKMSDELGRMFYLISEKYTHHRYFVRYKHIRSDLISVGLVACCRGFERFAPLKGDSEWDGSTIEYDYRVCNNPFAFFTTVIHNGFLQFIKKEYGYSNVQNKIRSTMGLETTYGYNDMIAAEEERQHMVVDEEDNFDVNSSPLHGMSVWDDYGEGDDGVDDSLIPDDRYVETVVASDTNDQSLGDDE